MKNKLRFVYIEWIDTIGDSEQGWKSEEETDKFFKRIDNLVKEVGFIWNEDNDYLNIVGKYMPSNDDETLSSHRTKIPKKWIIKLIDLTNTIE